MKTHRYIKFAAVLEAALWVAGCKSELEVKTSIRLAQESPSVTAAAETPLITEGVSPTPTPQVSTTPTPVASPMPEPAGGTPTPTPTSTPTPTLSPTPTPRSLTSIQVLPATSVVPKGLSVQLVATGTYNDNTTEDLTNDAAWTAGSPSIASINSTGLATVLAASGTTTITAQVGSVQGAATIQATNATLVSLSVSPASSTKPKGMTQQFTATGSYTDGSNQDISGSVTWTTNDPSIATVSSSGLAAAAAATGSATITATMGALSAPATLTATPAILTSVTVQPATFSGLPGSTQTFSALGNYSDGSSAALAGTTWSSSTPSVVTVNGSGLATIVAAHGASTVSATSGSIVGTTAVSADTPVYFKEAFAIKKVRGQSTAVSLVGGSLGGSDVPTNVSISAGPTAVDGAGNLYILENNFIRVIAATTGTIFGLPVTTGKTYVVAGDGYSGLSADGTPARSARFNSATSIAVDSSGNLFICDDGNRAVRVVAATTGTILGVSVEAGKVYRVAGNGTYGFSGDSGPAIAASLKAGADIALDTAGNLYIADYNNDRIRVVAAVTGTIHGVAVTPGNIYSIVTLTLPRKIAVDGSGNLYVADTFNYRVVVYPVVTGTLLGVAVTAGTPAVVAGTGVGGFSGDGGAATAAQLHYPQTIGFDSAGNLYICDYTNRRVRMVASSTGTIRGIAATAGRIYTVAGDGVSAYAGDNGPAASASISYSVNIHVSPTGHIFISDGGSRIRVVAGTTGSVLGVAVSAETIYTVGGNGAYRSGVGGSATEAQLPGGTVAVDRFGNTYLGGGGYIHLIAAVTGTVLGQAVVAGNVYSIAGNGANGDSGDGGPAANAVFGSIGALAIDQAGNLYIADYINHRVRVIAATTGTIFGVPVTVGNIYTVAGSNVCFIPDYGGGPATAADLCQPYVITFDPSGNLYIADSYNWLVWVVAAANGSLLGNAVTANYIYQVAGTGSGGFTGDNGPATAAQIYSASGLAVDSQHNVFISQGNRIRMVAGVTGSVLGMNVTIGNIYTVIGNGVSGNDGDGGDPLQAKVTTGALAVDASGNLFIAGGTGLRVVTAVGATIFGTAMAPNKIYTILNDTAPSSLAIPRL